MKMADARAGRGGDVGKRIELEPDVVQGFLLKTSLFSDPGVAFGVAERLEVWEVPAGTQIIRAGTPGEFMCILARGRASVAAVNASTGELNVLESLRTGDHFGEMGPLLGAGHTHTILAEETCVYLKVPGDVLESLLNKVPSFSRALAKRLSMRVVQLGMLAVRAGTDMGRVSKSPAEPKTKSPATASDGEVIPFAEVSDFEPTPNVISMIPERIVLEQRVLPLELKEDQLIVGMVAPKNEAAIAEVSRVLHRVTVKPVAISADDFQHALVRFRLTGDQDHKAAAGIRPEALTFDIVDSEREADKAIRVIGDEVVRAVNKILCAAIEREASDVHIEPDTSGVKVRFRVHGVLQDWNEYVAPSFAKGISARLKILSGLDITERRMPQDGRIAVNVGRREVDMRISTLPASRGEKVVLRVFEAAGMNRGLERTFVDKSLLSAVRKILGRKTGAILVAGATGSGKSTTLYSMLNEQRRMRPDSNVVMVEDPVEYRLQGVTQVQINHSIGLDFAQVLRSILRQDPDVIALGETRDTETARIALEAAMTGHLLLTSLHANNAIASLQRLETLGCPRELIAQSVALVLVQRLVRRLCPSCTRSDNPAPVLLDSLASRGLVEKGAAIRIPRAMGCEGCGRTGYLGRVAVIESLIINEEVRNTLMSGRPMHEVEESAIKSQVLTPFHASASYLMTCNLISGADALMAVAG